MVIEDGSWIQRWVYDGSGNRLSVEVSHADGTMRGAANADGEIGANFSSYITAGDIANDWYRSNLLGTTLYVVDATGDVIAHARYDAWGGPLTETYVDANYSGLESVASFASYSWDETLRLWYAQARHYDSAMRRFTGADPARDGGNWYAYCGGNPVNATDAMGLAVMIGDTRVETETIDGLPYARVRALVAAYGGWLSWYPTRMPPDASIPTDVYYRGEMKDFSLRFYTKRNGADAGQLEFERKICGMSHKFNIGDSFFTNIGGSNYINVEYFNKVMYSFGYGLQIEHLNPYKEYVDAMVALELGQADTGYKDVELLTTAQVAAIQTARSPKKLLDLWSGKTFNISWAASLSYHTDWTPLTTADTDIIKSIFMVMGCAPWRSRTKWASGSGWIPSSSSRINFRWCSRSAP
jgi:RHS repeat-associated protein